MLILVALIILYILICIGAFRLYFYLQYLNQQKRSDSLMKNINSYLLFACFICLEIPFAIFFPAWLSEKLHVFERTPNTTMYFLIFGCVVLATAIWKGRIAKKNTF